MIAASTEMFPILSSCTIALFYIIKSKKRSNKNNEHQILILGEEEYRSGPETSLKEKPLGQIISLQAGFAVPHL